MDIKNIKTVMDSGDVLRFHALPKMPKQKMSQHEWGVALLCRYLDPDVTADELMIALTHDANELITGDIPATLKWSYPEVKNLLNEIESKIDLIPAYSSRLGFKSILKTADYLEGLIYCYNQYCLGNSEGKRVYFIWKKALIEYVSKQFTPGGDIQMAVDALLREYTINE